MNLATGDFDTLLVLALCPSLDGAILDALNGPETRTLFAPTDAAFEATIGLSTIDAVEVRQ